MKQYRNALLGAIIGDISGSRFEWKNYKKKKDYNIFSPRCRFTDDTVMSIAVADALLKSQPDYQQLSLNAISSMQQLGRMYPNAGYGGRFCDWLFETDPKPYESWGNGAAMRVSGCGQIAASLEEAKMLSEKVTAVSHNHPEGIKGAEALTTAIFLARTGHSMAQIREEIEANYYTLDFTLDEIRKTYRFDVSCQGSVPQALEAFFEAVDFEDAIRNAISIGGDSDTIAAMCGSLAAVYFGIPEDMVEQAMTYLPPELMEIVRQFLEITGA